MPKGKSIQALNADVIRSFCDYVVQRDGLEVGNYLSEMGQAPFFLVAATGLGKTVAVPVRVLALMLERAASKGARVWVVEPRIPIATDQESFMNGLWREFCQKKLKTPYAPLFGCITSQGPVNPRAPILFVTTGIFGLKTRNDELDPHLDRVIIDEAHVTVEQNAEVELGIALARRAGVAIDYMSATVDVDGLESALGVHIIRADQARYPIWKRNLGRSAEDVLPDLISKTLVQPDFRS